MGAEIIRGKFQHFKQPRQPERQAKLEAAQGEELGTRMSMWLVHAEKFLGLSATRAMLLNALAWVDSRMTFKRGQK